MIYHGNIRTSTLQAPPAAITELHGGLCVDTDTTFQNLVKVTGPITTTAKAKFPTLKECPSLITLRAPTELPSLTHALGIAVYCNGFITDLPSLLVVGAEDLAFHSPINAPKLEKILRHLEAYFPASLPSLRSVEGNAYLDRSIDLSKLETVRSLEVSAESNLPSLHTVERGLATRTNLMIPELRLVGGNLFSTGYLAESPILSFPKLKTVCRSIALSPGTTLDTPNLEAVGGDLILGEVFVAPKLRSVLGCLNVGRTNFDHSATTFKAGKILAVSYYALHVSDSGLYSAGCRGPWTAAEALRHWNDKHSTPARATLFKEAILLHESSK